MSEAKAGAPSCAAWGVVPAAGRSRRMGRDKATLPFAGDTVVEALLEALARGGVAEVCVVVAPGSPVVGLLAGRDGVRLVENERPERGMLSSVLVGLRALGGAGRLGDERRPLVVCPVDHPAIRPATVPRLLAAIERGAGLAVPVHEGSRGHPIAIAPRLVDAIESLDLEVGLRQLLEREAGSLVEVPVDDPGTVLDLDTPEDYERLLARLG